jgi:hypothetical protein
VKPLLVSTAILFVMLAGIAAKWATDNFSGRSDPQNLVDDPRLKFRSGAYIAQEAVNRYRALPANERRTLKDDLLASLSDLEDWSRGAALDARLICLGERHDNAVRRFIALQVLPRLNYRVLMLETGEDSLAELKRTLILDGMALLLGARIDSIMHAVGRNGVPPRLVGIDETREELQRRMDRTSEDHGVPTREETLTRKVVTHWREDSRVVVLMGALHCRDTRGWLFHRLASTRPGPNGHDMLAVAALARSQEAGARLLFYLLEEMGIQRRILVIPDVARFPRQIQSWLPQVADAFAGYRSVLLFDDRES